MRIGLVGDRGAGKTCFFGGLYAKYSAPQSFIGLNQVYFDRAMERGWRHMVNFHIERVVYDGDRSKLETIAGLLRSRPAMAFPPPTTFTDHFPMEINFLSSEIKTNMRTSRQKRFDIVDVPGMHLAHDYHDPQARSNTINMLNQCDALIVFIDTEDYSSHASEHASSLLQVIGKIMQDASAQRRHTSSLTPVSIIFSKFDTILRNKQKEASRMMFDKFALDLSGYTPNIFAMSCPISIRDPERDQFRAYNIELPFIFSAMGIIYSQFLTVQGEALIAQASAERTRELRSLGPWERFKRFMREGRGVEKTIGAAEAAAAGKSDEASRDRQLARQIYEYLCIEEMAEYSHVLFAQDGEQRSLSQIGIDI